MISRNLKLYWAALPIYTHVGLKGWFMPIINEFEIDEIIASIEILWSVSLRTKAAALSIPHSYLAAILLPLLNMKQFNFFSGK